MSGANERIVQATMTGPAALPSELSRDALNRRMHRRGEESRWWWLVPTLYILVLLLPVYALLPRAETLLRSAGGRRFVRTIGIGLGIALATGLGAFAFGRPFLTSAFGHPVVPWLGELPLATAALFDLGVYITVVSSTLLTLSVLGAASKPVQPT